MDINKTRLTTALSTLKEDEKGDYYFGQFTYLLANVRGAAFLRPIGLSTSINMNQLVKRLLIVNTNLWNIATVCHRLIWQQIIRNENDNRLNDEMWRFYGSCDIDLFFGKYRLIFDSIAQIIKTIAKTPSALPESFNDLLTWIKKTE